MWLADQGADVVKVEAPETGDITRGLVTTPDLHGMSGLFVNCNRGKRSISLDVTVEEGRQVVLDLCRTADVFIQNWRPGVVERLGLGYDAVSAVRPEIVYVSISGFGPDGPYAQRRVYDPIIQALTGFAANQVNPEVPFPDLIRTLVCDKATALTVAQAVTAALFARERGGSGQHLVVPMLDAALAFFFPDGFMTKALLDDAGADQRPTISSTYRISRTADGYLVIYVAGRPQEVALYRALDHPEWIEDPRFATPAERRRHSDVLGVLVADAVERWTTSELSVRLDREGVPFAPVLDLDELQHDPQIVLNQALRVREHADLGRLLEAVQPVRYSATAPDVAALAPRLGQHSEEILRELGRTDDDLARLRAAGVIA
jgi:crotonobetainyl-CoA:carnitine CoA-transferase CaiB-like acyl-CoA transferase